jgi:hypothetical protein
VAQFQAVLAILQYVALFQAGIVGCEAVDAMQSRELDTVGMQLFMDQMTHNLTFKAKQEGPQGS